jgi:hypothetical protein
LRRYKDAPAVAARHHFSAVLARLLAAFLRSHLRCLEQSVGLWDVLAVVPSSSRRPASWVTLCPFDAVVGIVGELARWPRLGLTGGAGRAAHLRPATDAFVVTGLTAGSRVLLLDDTWVTGARARSAAAAIAGAGGHVVATVVIGRSVDPTAAPRLQEWWDSLEPAPTGATGLCSLAACRPRLPVHPGD